MERLFLLSSISILTHNLTENVLSYSMCKTQFIVKSNSYWPDLTSHIRELCWKGHPHGTCALQGPHRRISSSTCMKELQGGNPSYALLSTSMCSNRDAVVPSLWDGLIYTAMTVENQRYKDRKTKTVSVSFSQPIGQCIEHLCAHFHPEGKSFSVFL